MSEMHTNFAHKPPRPHLAFQVDASWLSFTKPQRTTTPAKGSGGAPTPPSLYSSGKRGIGRRAMRLLEGGVVGGGERSGGFGAGSMDGGGYWVPFHPGPVGCGDGATGVGGGAR